MEDTAGSDAGGKLISLISLALLPKMSPVVLDSGSFLATAALLPSEIFSPMDSAMLAAALLLSISPSPGVFLVSGGLLLSTGGSPAWSLCSLVSCSVVRSFARDFRMPSLSSRQEFNRWIWIFHIFHNFRYIRSPTSNMSSRALASISNSDLRFLRLLSAPSSRRLCRGQFSFKYQCQATPCLMPYHFGVWLPPTRTSGERDGVKNLLIMLTMAGGPWWG